MSWTTTFHYQQELTSAYMNSLVNGLIRPGLHSIDATIFTASNEDTLLTEGVYLQIKAGSMLVFSNGYTIVDGRYIRDLETMGSYIVKCVLNADMSIPLALTTSNYLINGVDAPVAFVCATFTYDPLAEGSLQPTFRICIPSSNTNAAFDSMRLPNEDILLASTDTDISYLILGALLDNQIRSTDYADGSSGWKANGEELWIDNHVFTGRAFPDYKGSMFKQHGYPLCTTAFAEDYSNMYFTGGQFYFNSNLYQIDGLTWKQIYGQGGAANATLPTAYTGFITDGEFAAKGDDAYAVAAPSLTADALVAEFLFLALNTEYSRGDLPSLENLFADPSRTKRLVPFRVTCTAPSGELDSSELWSDYFSSAKLVVPLDVATSNIERLKTFIKNRNVILPVVDYIRQQGSTASPFLEPTVGESLLPIMVSFRKVNATGTDYTDPQSVIASGACNPANILSFFELQSSSYTVAGVGLVAFEVYSTLPFLD